jgi:hypothetical protein
VAGRFSPPKEMILRKIIAVVRAFDRRALSALHVICGEDSSS